MSTSERLLTKYAPGSLLELLFIAIPLILSVLSNNLMIFVDRLIMSYYSTEAMNSVAAASMAWFMFAIGAITVAAIAEVFSGQNNGAKRYDQVSKPVWQMIWFAIILQAIFMPLAMFNVNSLLPPELYVHGKPYFYILMSFLALAGISVALGAFFASIGKTHIITIAAVVGNLLNGLLDMLLVFGYGPIPEMGSAGAALATVSSQVIQCLILFLAFFSKHNREKYNTHHFGFDFKLFRDCISVGYPNAVGHMLEMFAWNRLFRIVAAVGYTFITVFTIGQTILILFVFLTEGLQKGVVVIASNMVGAKRYDLLNKLCFSALKIHAVIAFCIAIPLLICPDLLLNLLLANQPHDAPPIDMGHLHKSLYYLWIFLVFDGLVWIMAGFLTAVKDTKFIMITNVICVWMFAILPSYFIADLYPDRPYYTWIAISLYTIANSCIFVWRYKYMLAVIQKG